MRGLLLPGLIIANGANCALAACLLDGLLAAVAWGATLACTVAASLCLPERGGARRSAVAPSLMDEHRGLLAGTPSLPGAA